MVVGIATGALVALIVAILVVAIGGGILFYLFVYFRFNCRKQVRNLEKQFSYYDSLLIGQDSQYIHRLEIISRTNLLYLDKYEYFQRRFRNIYDIEDKYADSILKQLSALIKAKQYKNIKSVISEAKKAIDTLSESVKSLDHDLYEVIKLEEDCRRSIDHLKEVYRHVKQTYYSESDDLELVATTFNKMFDKIDYKFSKFDDMLEGAEYEEIQGEIDSLEEVLNALGHVLIDLSTLCRTVKTVIPERLVELQNKYKDTEKEGVPLYHLSFKVHIDEWKKKLSELTKKIINLQCGGIKTQCDIILTEIDEYGKLLDEEISAREYFNGNYSRIYNQVNDVEKLFLRICAVLPEIKEFYLVSELENDRINELSKSVDSLGSAKRYLDGFVHSGTRQPFSLLKTKLDELEETYKVVNEGVMNFKNYVDSLKSTAEEAYNLISVYYHRIKLTESLLDEIGNESIKANYQEKIDAVYDVLNDIYDQIQSKPINVDEVSRKIEKLKNLANAMFEEVESISRNQKAAETSIMLLNQERDEQDINQTVVGLELGFEKGEFSTVNFQATSIYRNRHTNPNA